MNWPYSQPVPAGPGGRRAATVARVCAYCVLAAALIVPAVRFTHDTAEAVSAGAASDGDRVKSHKGAIGRWCKAVGPFWEERNIYLTQEQLGKAVGPGNPALHPNMPFVVVLISPLAYMPATWMAMLWSLLKIVAVLASLLMAARIAAPDGRRIPDWVLALGVLWIVLPVTDDMLHGNTNAFVMAAVVLQFWLYRKGREYLGGAALSLAICLKMTPGIFLLYWAYQRSWKVLVGAVAGLVVLAVVIPAAAVGPTRYAELTGTWLDNLIVPGLVEGAWYPIHVNQSLGGVLSRYLLPRGEADSNIYWNPDDNPYDRQTEFGWIGLAALSERTVKAVFRLCQVSLLALGAWAIGWRRLPRDDARRALHYGVVTALMLLLNQRTWEHHMPVLLVAWVAVWFAVAFGRLGKGVRPAALAVTLLAGAVYWLSRSDLLKTAARALGQSRAQAESTADVVSAYGPAFLYVLLAFAACVALSVALRRRGEPYAEVRQKVGDFTPAENA
jgi:hypothetical protein